MWLTAEQVADASLRALPGGTLMVIPGWRYQWLVAALRSLPMWLKLRLEAAHTGAPGASFGEGLRVTR